MSLLTLFKQLSPVLSATLVGYFCAYLFEIGYLHYFELSWQSARVTVNSFIVATILGISIGYLIRMYIYPLLNFLTSDSSSYIAKYFKKNVFVLFLLIVFFGGFGYFLNKDATLLYMMPLYGFGYIILDLVLLIIFHWRPKKKWEEVFEEGVKREEKVTQVISNSFTEIFETVVRLSVVLGLIFSVGGMIIAQAEENFYTFSFKGDEFVVIREYDNLIIGKQYANGQISGRIIYINSSNNVLLFESKLIKE